MRTVQRFLRRNGLSVENCLADEAVFKHPVLFHGIITWNTGEINITPETGESCAYEEMAMSG